MKRRLPAAQRVIVKCWKVIMDQTETVHQLKGSSSGEGSIVMATDSAAALYHERRAKSLSTTKDAVLRGICEMSR